MDVQRRTMVTVVVALALAAPAGILRAACVGKACEEPAPEAARVPFCSLPQPLRDGLAAGFYDGQSPDVLAIAARGAEVAGETRPAARPAVRWPQLGDRPPRVPLMFAGHNVHSGAEIPSGTRLDAIAPTLANAVGLERPHPEVRSGRELDVVSRGEPPRLVVIVVWKGIGSEALEHDEGSWASTRALMEDGAVTLDASTGALPASTPATMTTIGTGGLPRQHGITGTWVRRGTFPLDVVRASSEEAPVSVIATLGDDLDELLDQEPQIGLVGTDRSDRGAIGGAWYAANDEDVLRFERPGAVATTVMDVLAGGFGDDSVTDLLVVALEGDIARLDRDTAAVVAAADGASNGSLLTVVTATGEQDAGGGAHPARRVVAQVESLAPDHDLVEGFVPGGFFLDPVVASEQGVTEKDVLETIFSIASDGRGEPVFADAFSDLAVSLARYC